MTVASIVHTTLGSIALTAGAAVVLLPKGTMTHRRVGRTYAIAMLALCVLAFTIRGSTPFFGGFGAFHIMALVSLVTVGLGVRAVRMRSRSPDWRSTHLAWMLWSYVGLIMATGSHVVRPVFLALREPLGNATVAMTLTGLLLWGLPMAIGASRIPRTARQAEALGA